jgi:uncharacterized membrane protein YedE/YeeE
MNLVWLQELAGEAGAVALAGLAVGLDFGWSAQCSRFCLRAAVVEFARGGFGPRLSVWLLTFSTALFWTQGLALMGWLDLGESRWLAQPGSISGAILGGLIFGVGMVLVRKCPGRLLVLAATGNLRALLSGLVFAAAAQMSLRGLLAPMRSELAGGLVTDGPNPEITAMLGLGEWVAMALGVAAAIVALGFAAYNRVSGRTLIFGSAVGFSVALGWALTQGLAQSSFEPVPVESLTFSGPSADMLMFFLLPEGALNFDIGLIPGVAAGAFLAAAWMRELQWQGWSGAQSMHRYLIGAALMGFGAMLAGGCSIGAGVTGGSALALTAWIALTAMWIGGAATDALVDRGARKEGVAA